MKRRTVAIMPQSKGIGDADQPKADANRNAIGDIHDELHQQVTRDTLTGIFKRLRGSHQIPRTGKPDEAIPNVPSLEKHEDHEDDDDAGGGKWLDQWPDHHPHDLE